MKNEFRIRVKILKCNCRAIVLNLWVINAIECTKRILQNTKGIKIGYA